MSKVDFLIQSIRQILALRSPQEITEDGKGLKHAGVLIPLLQE
jgi:hypothetical protein